MQQCVVFKLSIAVMIELSWSRYRSIPLLSFGSCRLFYFRTLWINYTIFPGDLRCTECYKPYRKRDYSAFILTCVNWTHSVNCSVRFWLFDASDPGRNLAGLDGINRTNYIEGQSLVKWKPLALNQPNAQFTWAETKVWILSWWNELIPG